MGQVGDQGEVQRVGADGQRLVQYPAAAHPTMIEVAAEHGYDLSSHRGVQVSEELLAWADVVLAMDTTVLDALKQLPVRSAGPERGLYLGDRDVPDPWKQPREAFASCVTAVEARAHKYLTPT